MLDRDHIQLTGNAGDTLTASFSIENRASCGATLTKTRASKMGITVDCMKWSLAAAPDATTCTVTVVKQGFAPWKDRFLFAASPAEDCKPPALAIVIEREHRQLKPLEDELSKLQKATLDDPHAELSKREKALKDMYDLAIAENERLLVAAEQRSKEEHKTLDDIWKEQQAAQQQRIEKQRLKVQMLPSDESAMRALDSAIADQRKRSQSEVTTANTKRVEACVMIGTLRDQKDDDLRELRLGYWHSECGRTKSQIEHDTGRPWEEHLGKIGGTMEPPPQSTINRREKEWDARIAGQREKCDQLTDQERAAQQRGIDAIKALEAKRPEIRKKKELAIEKARAELDILETQSRRAVISQRERHQKVSAKLIERLKELNDTRTNLDKKYATDKQALWKSVENAEDDRREKVRLLNERIGKLRSELILLANNIRNAHHAKQNLGVLIDATFR